MIATDRPVTVKFLRSSFIIALVIAFTATVAYAAEPEVPQEREFEEDEISSDDIEKAQEYFDLGAQLYYEGEHSRAAVEFRRAHDIYPHPLFLFNMALSFQRLGRLEDALSVARQAREMEEKLPAEQDAQNKALIDGVETSLFGVAIIESTAPTDPRDDGGVETPPDVDAEPGLGALGWTGVGAAGLGVAALVGGGVVHSQLAKNREVYEPRFQRNPDSEVVSQLGDTIAAQETQRAALFISGASLAAIGTGLIVITSRSTNSDSDVALSFSVLEPGLWATIRW